MTAQHRERVDALTDLKYIGETTAEAIAGEGITADGVREKRVSYRMLVEAGTNEGVATKVRREHSLPWSITGEASEDLGKRSDQVRGLQDDERAWVAASSGDWASDAGGEDASGADADDADDSSPVEADGGESAWRERSKPEPVTEVDDVDEDVARQLAKAGITSVRSLATAEPELVSDVLGLEEERVAGWIEDAGELS